MPCKYKITKKPIFLTGSAIQIQGKHTKDRTCSMGILYNKYTCKKSVYQEKTMLLTN